MNEWKLFVAYSRSDERLVSLLVQLLRTANPHVFQDVTNIKPGDKWETVIMTSLAQATTVIVVWCSHASRSNWVVREANTARELGKRIVPVFLDKTPAPDFLMQFQGIDFSGKFNHASLGSAIGNAFLGVLRAFGKALGWAAMRSLVVLVLVCGLFGMTLVVGPTSYTLAYPIIDFRELLTFVAIIALFAAGVTGISGIVSSIIAWHQHRRAIPVQARELASAIRGHLERPLTLLQGGEG